MIGEQEAIPFLDKLPLPIVYTNIALDVGTLIDVRAILIACFHMVEFQSQPWSCAKSVVQMLASLDGYRAPSNYTEPDPRIWVVGHGHAR